MHYKGKILCELVYKMLSFYHFINWPKSQYPQMENVFELYAFVIFLKGLSLWFSPKKSFQILLT